MDLIELARMRPLDVGYPSLYRQYISEFFFQRMIVPRMLHIFSHRGTVRKLYSSDLGTIFFISAHILFCAWLQFQSSYLLYFECFSFLFIELNFWTLSSSRKFPPLFFSRATINAVMKNKILIYVIRPCSSFRFLLAQLQFNDPFLKKIGKSISWEKRMSFFKEVHSGLSSSNLKLSKINSMHFTEVVNPWKRITFPRIYRLVCWKKT